MLWCSSVRQRLRQVYAYLRGHPLAAGVYVVSLPRRIRGHGGSGHVSLVQILRAVEGQQSLYADRRRRMCSAKGHAVHARLDACAA